MEERFCEVKVVCENVLTEEFVKLDSDAVKFYTGLPPHSHLKAVFKFVSTPLGQHPNSVSNTYLNSLQNSPDIVLTTASQLGH